MRRLLLALALVACGATPTPPAPSRAPNGARQSMPRALIVIGTSDLHGHLQALPVLAGYLDNLRAEAAESGAEVLLVDAGDMFQGTLESNLVEGESITEAYGVMGYDAVAVGNHEFDFGPLGPATSVAVGSEAPQPEQDPRGALRARARAAGFPFLLANAQPSGAAVDLSPIRSRALVTRGGIRVGVIGVTSADTASTTLAANVRDLRFEEPALALRREAEALRREGATVVVGLAHAGSRCEHFTGDAERDACRNDGEIFQAARALPPGTLDAIVAGHTHAGVAHAVNGIPIVQSFSYGAAFGRIDLRLDTHGAVLGHQIHAPRYLCPESKGPADESCTPGEYAGKPVERDPRVLAIAAKYAERTRARRDAAIGVTFEAPVTRSYGEESALGNLFAQLLRQHTRSDVALMNGGGLRDDLPAGPLRYGQLFAAMPFDNRVASVTVTAGFLRELFAKNLQSSHGILSVDGLSIEASCRAEGKLVVDLYRVDARGARRGGKLADATALTVTASDFLLGGGDDFAGRAGVGELRVSEDVMRDVFERGLRDLGSVHPSRWFDPKHPHLRLARPRPLQCRR